MRIGLATAVMMVVLCLSVSSASAIVSYDSDANSSFTLIDSGGMAITYTIGVEPTDATMTGTGIALLDADMHTPGPPPMTFPAAVGAPVMIDSEVSGSAAAPAGTSMAEVPNGIFVELDNLGSSTPSTAVFEFSYSWLADVTRTDVALEAGFASPFFHLTGFAPSGTETLAIDEDGAGGDPPMAVAEWLVHPAVGLDFGSGPLSVMDSGSETVLALVTLPPDSFNSFSVITDSAGGAATPPRIPEPASAGLALMGLAALAGRRRRRV